MKKTLLSIAAAAVSLMPQAMQAQVEIREYKMWNFLEEPDKWSSREAADVYDELTVSGTVKFESEYGRYKIDKATGNFSFYAATNGYLVIHGKTSRNGLTLNIGDTSSNTKILLATTGCKVYSRKINLQDSDKFLVDIGYSSSSYNASIFSIAYIPEGSDQDKATKSATLDAMGYATYYPCYSVKIPEGVKAYYMSKASATDITFEELIHNIPANTAVLLVGTANATVNFEPVDGIETGVAVEAVSYNTAAAGRVKEGDSKSDNKLNYLHSIYQANGLDLNGQSDSSKDYYAYKKGTGMFCKVVADIKAPFGKGYFSLSKTTSNAKEMRIDLGGITSATNVKMNQVEDDAWYTLQGVRVAKPTKGVYIHNGKTVMF